MAVNLKDLPNDQGAFETILVTDRNSETLEISLIHTIRFLTTVMLTISLRIAVHSHSIQCLIMRSHCPSHWLPREEFSLPFIVGGSFYLNIILDVDGSLMIYRTRSHVDQFSGLVSGLKGREDDAILLWARNMVIHSSRSMKRRAVSIATSPASTMLVT
jgi:hypothetical protein